MKKLIISAALILGTGTIVVSTTQSCTALATSDLGLGIIKRILLGGINKGVGVYSNKDAFLQNNMVDKALPSQLRDLNKTLEKVAPNLVAKERDYIAQAAVYTVNISKPILENAVNSLNASDVTRIIQGQKGIGTQILKEKSQQQLVAAIMPKVNEKLNEFGIVKTLNSALKGTNLLGSLLGGNKSSSSNLTSGGLSQMASEQLVNGLFNIIEDYEVQNSNQIYNIIGGK